MFLPTTAYLLQRTDEWETLLNFMDVHDSKMLNDWKDELANLLTFVRGFSYLSYTYTNLSIDRSVLRSCYRICRRLDPPATRRHW